MLKLVNYVFVDVNRLFGGHRVDLLVGLEKFLRKVVLLAEKDFCKKNPIRKIYRLKSSTTLNI